MQKLINFALALIFIILVILFVYKMTKTPEVISASVHDSSSQTIEEKKDITDSKEFKTDMQQIIKDYIMNNPEVIIQSLEALHNKNLAESTKKTSQFLQENKTQIEQVDSPPIIGNPNGDITVVAFFDYNCSFCRQANQYENEIIALDPGVKIILRPIPILGGTSSYASKIALAVQKISSDNFQKVHNELMSMKEINEETVKPMLAKYNIDYSLIENEVNSYGLKQIITKNFEIAKELGIKGTPSYVINGNFVSGLITTDRFKSIILQLRAMQEKPAVPAADALVPESSAAVSPSPAASAAAPAAPAPASDATSPADKGDEEGPASKSGAAK